jgi:hypothetical protein
MDDTRMAGRTRLAAAQLALQVVGLLRPGVDTAVAAQAAQRASQDVRITGQEFAGLTAEELLNRIETIEGSLAEETLPAEW